MKPKWRTFIIEDVQATTCSKHTACMQRKKDREDMRFDVADRSGQMLQNKLVGVMITEDVVVICKVLKSSGQECEKVLVLEQSNGYFTLFCTK